MYRRNPWSDDETYNDSQEEEEEEYESENDGGDDDDESPIMTIHVTNMDIPFNIFQKTISKNDFQSFLIASMMGMENHNHNHHSHHQKQSIHFSFPNTTASGGVSALWEIGHKGTFDCQNHSLEFKMLVENLNMPTAEEAWGIRSMVELKDDLWMQCKQVLIRDLAIGKKMPSLNEICICDNKRCMILTCERHWFSVQASTVVDDYDHEPHTNQINVRLEIKMHEYSLEEIEDEFETIQDIRVFEGVETSWDHNEDDYDDKVELPARWTVEVAAGSEKSSRARDLAFAFSMLAHPRLGGSGSGSFLHADHMHEIHSKLMEDVLGPWKNMSTEFVQNICMENWKRVQKLFCTRCGFALFQK